MSSSFGQKPPEPAAKTPVAAAAPKPAPDYSTEGFVIQKYATDIRFAADGTGERVITVLVKILSESAVRQFGVLEFAYESRNEHLDFVYVRVRKLDGTVIATPDTEAQDQPAEVTRQAPFYSDIRNKQLPVKSLSVGDQLEYQVHEVRTVASAPGHFWYTQSFLTNQVVLEETVSLDVPRQKYVQVESSDLKPEITETGDRKIYHWKTSQLEKTKVPDDKTPKPVIVEQPPSIAVTTFKDWAEVGRWYGDLQKDRVSVTPAIQAKADDLVKGLTKDDDKIAALYTYVSTQYRYIGVAFGIGRYQPHTADDVMQNQYGDCKDKHTLLASLLKAEGYDAWPVLVGSQHVLRPSVPSPGQFDHVITAVTLNKSVLWMDSTPEVAPFQLLYLGLRDKQVLGIPNGSTPVLMKTPPNPPFDAFDQYDGKATLAADGILTAHFEITLRGDDELSYRIGFHQTPRVQWQTLAQNIAYASGFAGTVSNVDAGSPEQLAKPFSYSYDYTRKDYGDWANRRILALSPMISFAYGEDDAKPVDTILLGGPVSYKFHSTIQLPAIYTAELPPTAKIHTDFAEYGASYSQNNGVLAVDRILTFRQREIPVSRWDEYIKFEKAVSNEAGSYIQLIGAGAKQTAGLTPSNEDAAKLIQQAWSEIQQHDFAAARQTLSEAKKLNATESGLWSDYGALALSGGNQEDAIADYRKEIQSHPENFPAYRLLAWMLSAANRKDEAIEVLRDLVKADPSGAEGLRELGDFLMQQKRFAEAVPVLQQAVAQSPDKVSLKVSLGTAQLSGGNRDAGIVTLKEVLAGATDQGVMNDAAYALADANAELPLAHTSCEKALKLLDDATQKISLAELTDDDMRRVTSVAATWDTMAWVLYREGELDKAKAYANAAWMLDQRATVAIHLGRILEKQGKRQEAIQSYRLAVAAKSSSDNSDAAEAEERLKALDATEMSFTEKGGVQEKLGALRSVSLSIGDKHMGSADFFILFSPQQVEDVLYLKGTEALKTSAPLLRKAKYDVPFPPGSEARIVRRGILFCSEVPKDCQFTMIPPENAGSN